MRDQGVLRLAQQLDINSRLAPQNGDATSSDIQLAPKPTLREGGDAVFVLTAVEFTGLTVFSPDEFAALYDNYLARAVTLDDVSRLVDAVTQAYHRQGYFLTRATAPAQNGAGGVLRIDIAEGYIDHVKINGDAPARVKRMLAKLKDERPTQLKSLERTLTLIGDLNGVSVVSSQLHPDPDVPARHLLEVEVAVDHAQASLYVDNRG
ncbi:MAG: POTRA domain-containing protein, partial [Hyphococcus sp.]